MKHKKKHTSNHGKKRSVLLTVSIILISLAVVMGTVAILIDVTDPLQNRFAPSNVSCAVQDDNTVKNTGDIAVYIRVAVSSTWQDSAGNVYGKNPNANVTATGWIAKDDGYFYWPDPLDPEESTGAVSSATDEISPDADYEFTYEIGAQAIQSVPDNAIEEAWGVTLTNGRITG